MQHDSYKPEAAPLVEGHITPGWRITESWLLAVVVATAFAEGICGMPSFEGMMGTAALTAALFYTISGVRAGKQESTEGGVQ